MGDKQRVTVTKPRDFGGATSRKDSVASAKQNIGALRWKFSDEELKEYCIVMCPECMWIGLSRDCAGGEALSDTGDYSELYCPKCFKNGEGHCVTVEDLE